jgi:hypothetical protein
VGANHAFVRDEIAFGYNATDATPASRVLAEGRGQCNTKGVLLMALLRAVGMPCRVHGFTIHKRLQRGVVPEAVYPVTPDRILHSWIECRVAGRWQVLEGFIIDSPLLRALQAAFPGRQTLCAYGIGTEALQAPPIDAAAGDTFIQHTGIAEDLGVFDTPDAFLSHHAQDLGWLKDSFYRHAIRHWMNARVAAMRRGRIPPIPGLCTPVRPSRRAGARDETKEA